MEEICAEVAVELGLLAVCSVVARICVGRSEFSFEDLLDW